MITPHIRKYFRLRQTRIMAMSTGITVDTAIIKYSFIRKCQSTIFSSVLKNVFNEIQDSFMGSNFT